MPHVCVHCNRSFSRKIYFERHQYACELMQKSSDERRFELEEHADTPTPRKQYELILELAHMVKSQQKKIKILEGIVQRTQKKKLSVTAWLDENASPSQSFNEWFGALEIDQTDVERVFEHDHIKGIISVLENKTSAVSIETLPIRSFKQKENTLYIFNGEKWEAMSVDLLKTFVACISKGIRVIFRKWVDENQEKIDNLHSDFSTTYLEKLYKVNGGKFTTDQIHSRIKRGLHQHLKTDLQNVIEYEFTF